MNGQLEDKVFKDPSNPLEVLSEKELLTDISTLNKVKADFFNIAGFPNIVGAIDGTHIRIDGYPLKPWLLTPFVNPVSVPETKISLSA